MASDFSASLQQSLSKAFEANFQERGELGASVSVFHEGVEVAHLSQGFTSKEQTTPWTSETMVPVWSATKGPAAVACLCALEDADYSLDAPVSAIWPEFAGGGKSEVTLQQVLSHTAGLYALDEPVSVQDYPAVIAALESQVPAHPPGTRQGYHARTFGFLLDELVRRTTGAVSLGEYFRERLAHPMGIDFWIGLPADLMPRVATLYAGKLRTGLAEDPFFKAYSTRGSATQRAFASPSGIGSVHDMNLYETLSRGYASMGGVGTARSLAAFYAMLAEGGTWKGRQMVSKAVLEMLKHPLSQRSDEVLQAPVAFTAGVMKDALHPDGRKQRQIFGSSPGALGHPGAGGSLAFADPGRRLSFAYVMNQMELGALPGEKTQCLVAAVDEVFRSL